jgi:hypothetical protein
MSPKGPCVNGVFPKITLLRGGGTFKRRGLLGGLLVLCDMPLTRQWDPTPFLFLSTTSHHESNGFAPPCVPTVLYTQAQNNRANQSWTETSQTVSQNKPVFLLS